MAYATHAQYSAYISPATVTDTAEVTRLLARASELIDEALIGAVYPVDTNGLPTDTAHIAAFRDAACAQVAWWEETGDEQGAASQYANVKIGDVTLSRAAAGSRSAGTSRRVGPHTVTILRNAGLLPLFPAVVG